MPIDMTPVSSSNIAAVGYDADSRELTIEFNSGDVYIYDGIDPMSYESLMQAPSVGSFFYRFIRNRSFRRG